MTTTATRPRVFTISPSDLGFIAKECPRCFYLKVARGVRRVSTPFPSAFSAFDRSQRNFYDGRSASAASPELRPGVFDCSDVRVQSTPLTFASAESQVAFRGTLDATLQFEDGTYGLVDFKTADARPANLGKYTMQLHAYTWALEHPAPGAFGLSPISEMGLLVFSPDPNGMIDVGDDVAFRMTRTWVPFDRDDAGFKTVLEIMCQMLESPEEPLASAGCEFCALR